MGRPIIWTREQLDYIFTAYSAGESFSMIARYFRVSRDAVQLAYQKEAKRRGTK